MGYKLSYVTITRNSSTAVFISAKWSNKQNSTSGCSNISLAVFFSISAHSSLNCKFNLFYTLYVLTPD